MIQKRQQIEKNPAETLQTADKQNMQEPEKHGRLVLVLGAMLVLTILVQGLNFVQQTQISSQLGNQDAIISQIRAPNSAAAAANYAPSLLDLPDVIPKGTPIIYGNELGVSFDDVSAADPQRANETIASLSAFDREASEKLIELSGNEKERYIKIASQIACEYCCGAKSLIFDDGKRACGCAHSYAMRGLAKYLLQNHPSDFTDDQILEELGKWKTLFFPGVLAQKAQVLKEKGIELNYINLASNRYRGIEKGAPQGSGQMVGGC